MYILSLGSLIAKLFRNIFFLIDSVIYNMIPKIYDLLITIAKTSPLSQADIADMASRIYKLLAVFMIFKVTFSLIMYVVNPDDFADKSKGVSKLITNIVISLTMLVLTPFIFNLAYQFQEIILTKNTLGTVIFGDLDAENSTIIDSAGEQMAYIAIRPFITPNLDYFDCAEPYYTTIDENNKKKTVLSKECFGFEDVNTNTDSNATCDKSAVSSDSLQALCAAVDKSNKSDKYLTNEIVNNYALGLQYGSHNLLLRRNTVTTFVSSKEEEFAFDYVYGISTAVGILILLFLISTCMDVGLRSIKLAFLQLIAPIPILSYVDPKSGKDGMFKKWYQMAFKTYISLFVRILALYFAIYVIGKIGRLVNVIDGSYTSSCLVTVFIVIGALMFAKNLIKILEALGIKFDGDFQLFPVKKLKEQALGGKQLVGAAGAVGAAALAGGVNAGHRLFDTGKAIRDAWKRKDYDSDGNLLNTSTRTKGWRAAKAGAAGLAKTAGSSVAGVASAGHRGLIKAGKGEGFFKTFGNSYGEAMFSKIQREDLNRKGSTVWGRAKADFNRYIGRLNAAQQQELRYAELESQYNADIKKTKESKEALSRSKAITEKNKAEEIKVFQQNKELLSKIYESIAGMKNSHANVKDAQEFEDRMKENREFYAKLGDIGRDEHGNKVTVDATNLGKIMTEEGYAADQALTQEKINAFNHLKASDAGVKKYIEILKANGLDETAFTKSSGDFNKAAFEQQDINIRAVNAKYYSDEQNYAEQEKKFAEEEAAARNAFIARLTEAGLDKESAEWVANEANNAARNVKNPQPPGFKPTASVDPRAYTAFTTGVIMGNPPSGPGPVPPSPPPGGGGPAGP